MNFSELEKHDQALFNRISSDYCKKDFYVVSSKAREFQLNCLVTLFKEKLNQENLGNILELGCGIGASSRYLNGYYDKYIGVDYSGKFIDIANLHFKDKNVSFVCANIKDFKISELKIDFVFGLGVLHHVTELDEVLRNIVSIGDKNTIFGFLEPQASNPFVQLLRRTRMLIDNEYSDKQVFFKKNDVLKIFDRNGFKILKVKYQGYLTPPFAQVVIKPSIVFNPIISCLIRADKIIQKYFHNSLSWNLIWIAEKK